MSASQSTESVLGHEYVMEPPESIVGYRLKLNLPAQWVRLDASVAAARPPFEWTAEVTIDDASGLDHFLIRDNDVVRAIRKDISELTEIELSKLLNLLLNVKVQLKNTGLWKDGVFELTGL